MDKKIQFIVCGWWYDKFDSKENQTDFINQLIELNTENKNIDVFTIASTSNATDFGDLTANRYYPARGSCSDSHGGLG